MPTPRADTASIVSGGALWAGRDAPRAWLSQVSADNTWFELDQTAFYTWANGGGIAAGSYRGTDPFNTIINAYCDPAIDYATGNAYHYGGGHGDGTCNAVIKMAIADLAWSQVVDPTPPSVYLDDYLVTTDPIQYPSGVNFTGRTFQLGTFFATEAEGLDGVMDAGYIAPALARASTHMYAAAVYRPSTKTCHYFYNGYGAVNVETGAWSGYNVNLEAQIAALQSNLEVSENVWGVSAIYDAGTDRAYFLVTGGGFRSHVAEFDCDDETVDAVYPSLGLTLTNASMFVQVGRKLYIFVNEGSYPTYTAERGCIFNLDAKTWARFDCDGDAIPAIVGSRACETIPSWYDSTAGLIRRWNYSASHTTFYDLDLTPVSGTGTHADPYILTQTSRTVSIDGGSFPGPTNQEVSYVYSRVYHDPESNCSLFIPRSDNPSSYATGKYWAIRFS